MRLCSYCSKTMNIHSKPFTFFEQMCIVFSMHKVSSNQGMKPWTHLKELGFFFFFFERFFGGHPTECSFTSTKRHVFHFSQEKPIQSTGNPKKYFKEKINKFFMPSNTLGARHS